MSYGKQADKTQGGFKKSKILYRLNYSDLFYTGVMCCHSADFSQVATPYFKVCFEECKLDAILLCPSLLLYLMIIFSLIKPGACWHRLACAWFLIITSVCKCLYAYMCVSAPVAINNQWRDVV